MTDHSAKPQDPAKKDCGCGCGSDCAEPTPKAAGRAGEGRRRFLAGGISVATFTVTLPARAGPPLGPISAAGSPNHSGDPSGPSPYMGGKTPGYWKTHATHWPGITVAQICTATIGTLFAGTNPSASTLNINTSISLKNAACASSSQFYFQFVCAYLNAQAYGSTFGYPNGPAVAQAVVSALAALPDAGSRIAALGNGGSLTTALQNLNFDNGLSDPPVNASNPAGAHTHVCDGNFCS